MRENCEPSVEDGPRRHTWSYLACEGPLKHDEGAEGDQYKEQYHHQNDHQQERVAVHFAHSFPGRASSGPFSGTRNRPNFLLREPYTTELPEQSRLPAAEHLYFGDSVRAS